MKDLYNGKISRREAIKLGILPLYRIIQLSQLSQLASLLELRGCTYRWAGDPTEILELDIEPMEPPEFYSFVKERAKERNSIYTAFDGELYVAAGFSPEKGHTYAAGYRDREPEGNIGISDSGSLLATPGFLKFGDVMEVLEASSRKYLNEEILKQKLGSIVPEGRTALVFLDRNARDANAELEYLMYTHSNSVNGFVERKTLQGHVSKKHFGYFRDMIAKNSEREEWDFPSFP